MKRISKDPEERRRELIYTAERLFMERGYEHTAISDIVKELNSDQSTEFSDSYRSAILSELVAKGDANSRMHVDNPT